MRKTLKTSSRVNLIAGRRMFRLAKLKHKLNSITNSVGMIKLVIRREEDLISKT
jgi:hypothetical protein